MIYRVAPNAGRIAGYRSARLDATQPFRQWRSPERGCLDFLRLDRAVPSEAREFCGAGSLQRCSIGTEVRIVAGIADGAVRSQDGDAVRGQCHCAFVYMDCTA